MSEGPETGNVDVGADPAALTEAAADADPNRDALAGREGIPIGDGEPVVETPDDLGGTGGEGGAG